MKNCTKCCERKKDSDFYVRKSGKDKGYLLSVCIECCVLIARARRAAMTPEQRRKMLDTVKRCGIRAKAAFKARNGVSYDTDYRAKRKARDPNFRMLCVLRTRIWCALEGKTKSANTMDLIGCTPSELKIHLENQFRPGMTWDNHGPKGWHIDHIQPCSWYDLTDPVQQGNCFHFTNLQPLWWFDNLEKGAKIAA